MAYQTYQDFSTNSSNPYCLHPNENLALVLVSPLLDDKNYHSWSRSRHIALISKNKEKFIYGSLPKPPTTDPLYAPWIRCNTMVLVWLHCSISEHIAKSVLWIDSATGVWKNLQTRFSHSDLFCISDIQENLYKLRQGNLDVSNYFTQLKVLWDELDNYRPIVACSCAIPCSCGAIASIQTYRAQDCVIRFLNEKFTHSKSHIMMMIPLPDIDKAFSLVIQQEREMQSSIAATIPTENNNEETTAFQVQTNSGSYNDNPPYSKNNTQGLAGARGHSRVCTHCGRTNHGVETCFLRHGFPPSFKGKNKSQSAGTNNHSASTVTLASEASHRSLLYLQWDSLKSSTTVSLNSSNSQNLMLKPIPYPPPHFP
ncbi:uncharacterized protein LOC131639539 [Vicia villosa]|uniref:uncharacterized protein LOC131639539 n=1 Tax=Vicia villosa TaxID=3911 RepID=UPI00273B95FA|nr:uncharacterized protein LOC131639539 [Vicia villosa]